MSTGCCGRLNREHRNILAALGGAVAGAVSPAPGDDHQPETTVDRTERRGDLPTVAQTATVHYLDDLDGDQAAEETITFSLDGVSYPIDLSAEHATMLRGDLATWIDHARRTGGRTTALRASRRALRAESTAPSSLST